jgi:hypothetical protein
LCGVDERANRRLERQADDTGDGGHDADRSLIPMLLGQQENADVGTKAALTSARKKFSQSSGVRYGATVSRSDGGTEFGNGKGRTAVRSFHKEV